MVQAPMSGVSDEAFRLMFLKYGKPDVFWTEFVSADGLFSRGREYCLKLLKHSSKEHPIVAQIFGSIPANFEKAAEEVAKLGFDGIDINMGCPDNNIEKKGGGAVLIKNYALAKEIIRAAKKGASLAESRRAGKIPVSVKTRIGYSKNEVSKWIPTILEEQVDVLTVHFRTKKEMYFAPAHWELAKDIVKLRDKISPKTLILGNGDIKSLAQARKLVKETGIDGAMIGRAIIGNPWFFSDKLPTVEERLKAIIEHAEIFSAQGARVQDGSASGMRPASGWESLKKHFHAYTKGFRGAKELRDSLMKVKNLSEVKEIIESFLKYGKI